MLMVVCPSPLMVSYSGRLGYEKPTSFRSIIESGQRKDATSLDTRLIFGPLEPSAQHLIETARALAQPGTALDSPHVLLAALTDTNGGGKPALLALDDVTRATLVGALRVQAQMSAEQNANVDAITNRLRACKNFWNDEAPKRSLRLSDAFVVWAILIKDPLVAQVMQALAIDTNALRRDLEGRFAIIERVPPTMPAPSRLNEREALAYAEAAEHIEIVPATPGCHFAGMHAVLLANVFDVLGSCGLSQFVVLSGQNGTPYAEMPQVIADKLASGPQFSDARARLRDKRGVLLLDLTGIVLLAELSGKPEPHDVLRMTMKRAREEHSILVLNHIEILRNHQHVERTLLAELANPGETLVLGLYETHFRGDLGAERALDMPDILSVAARKYSGEQTRAVLREFYIPRWEIERGYTFADDAFDSVIALEPGAWINLKRKTLPDLVIGLAGDTIGTAEEGAHLIKDVARMALGALTNLRKEWATTDERIRQEFEATLEQARDDITRLIDAPDPVKDSRGYLVLTRAHVIAQLICPNASEFHYPGHAPEEVVGSRYEDMPPQA